MTDITELAQSLKAAAVRVIKNYDSEWFEAGHQICTVHKSKINLISLANPANILALVEALEKAQQQIQTHERAELTWMNALELPDDATRNDILPAIHAEKYTLRTANKRIAELESRTVTIEPFRAFVNDADLAALHRFAECCDDPESGGHDLEKEQVRRLESIGALQRSGRISYITGFGDFLISITAGIKWEAE